MTTERERYARQKERIENSRVVSKSVIGSLHADCGSVKAMIDDLEDVTHNEIKELLEEVLDDLMELMDDEGAFKEICSHCEGRRDS